MVDDKQGIQVHSQWCCLSQRDAECIVNARNLDRWFAAYKQMLPMKLVQRSYLLAPDELFIHTYLRHCARERGEEFKFANQMTTFAHCCLDMDSCSCSLSRASHPISLSSMHPIVVLRSMQRESFFARKFTPGQNAEHWEAVWRKEDDPAQAFEAATLCLALSVSCLLLD